MQNMVYIPSCSFVEIKEFREGLPKFKADAEAKGGKMYGDLKKCIAVGEQAHQAFLEVGYCVRVFVTVFRFFTDTSLWDVFHCWSRFIDFNEMCFVSADWLYFIVRSIDWLIDCSVDWLIDWLIDSAVFLFSRTLPVIPESSRCSVSGPMAIQPRLSQYSPRWNCRRHRKRPRRDHPKKVEVPESASSSTPVARAVRIKTAPKRALFGEDEPSPRGSVNVSWRNFYAESVSKSQMTNCLVDWLIDRFGFSDRLLLDWLLLFWPID